MADMQAIVFEGPGKVRLARRPRPALAEPTDAIVKMELASLCGTDLHAYRGAKPVDAGTTMGHEFCGLVQEEGARCYGWINKGVGIEGVQAEYVRVPLADTTLVPIPDEVATEQALLCADVLATGWFCAERAGVKELKSNDGEAVIACVGCGPVGLAAISSAISQGATRVFAIDRVPERLAMAQEFGAELVPEGADPVEHIRTCTSGRGADAVMEAVGSPGALRLAFDAVRVGGTISSVGMHHDAQFSFSPAEGYDKNIRYLNGRCPARLYMDELLARLARGDEALLATGKLVSHRVQLTDEQAVLEVYDKFDRQADNCVKVVISAS